MGRWMRRAVVATTGLLVLGCGRAETESPPRSAGRPGPRISMADLHRQGGVPAGWRFSLAPGSVDGGRREFADLGCGSCHRVPDVPSSAADETRGPDLAGMGSHHPAEYFAESIVNPDAVLVDGPGWIDPDGRSIMPAYPDVTVHQLADLVAYLKSLRAGSAAELAASLPANIQSEVPPPPAGPAAVFYVQVYDVLRGRLGAFEAWFRDEGRAAFLGHEGVVSVESWVDVAHDGPAMTTIVGFRDDAALRRFLDDPSTDALGSRFDEFIGPHQHRVFRRPPLYRADALSAP